MGTWAKKPKSSHFPVTSNVPRDRCFAQEYVDQINKTKLVALKDRKHAKGRLDAE